jgi:hypothetical protein
VRFRVGVYKYPFLLIALAIALPVSGAAGLEPGSLPNPRLTPGDVLAVGVPAVCTTGYSKSVRDVPASVKRLVYGKYGWESKPGICCEVDHLIPLALGGSNQVENLWPEPYNIKWNAHVKDALETYLHRRVCSGQLSLREAQSAIARNWIDAYIRYYGDDAGRRKKVR